MDWVKLFPSQQMLQYVSRDATLFIQSRWRQVFHFHFCFFSLSGTREVAQWCGTACGRRPVGHRNKMASTTLSERRHLECVIGSPSLSQSVSVQCSVRLPQKWEEEKKKTSITKKGWSDRLIKVWSEFQEAALVTMWGADHVIFLFLFFSHIYIHD